MPASVAWLKSILIHPEDLDRFGYWGVTDDSECEINLYQGYKDDSALSYKFEGSGIVGRLLHCTSCAQIEVTIDDEMPISVDLSKPSDYMDNVLQCPQNAPSFIISDLEHGAHVVKITRVNPEQNKPFKILWLEYLTSKKPEDDEGRSALDRFGDYLLPFAKDAAIFAFTNALTYGVQYVIYNTLSNTIFPNSQGESSGAENLGSNFNQGSNWEHVSVTPSSDGIPFTGGLDGVE
ncbi:hypothetical protein FRC02_008599 [Tulasnella sp. 418]|nr:hypothetical protein FRC02_008599 [Tulasnella sp. 418]